MKRRLWFVLAATAATTLLCVRARAFHAGAMFDKAPGAGGGGGVYYLGQKSERGWDCTACHLDAPRRIRLTVETSPASLLADQRYRPGAQYDFTVTLVGEHLGTASPLANFNSLALIFADAAGAPAGVLAGYAPEDFYSGNQAHLASAGTKPNQTRWTFTWFAPDAGAGAVTLRLSAVDGNGANSAPTDVLTDPKGDDFYSTVLKFGEGAAK